MPGRRWFARCVIFALLLAIVGGTDSFASQGQRPLVVATKEVPPFAFRDADGRWTGISIEVWSRIAEKLGLEYELREMDLAATIDALVDGTVDISVGAMTVNAERERRIDFTHPVFSGGIGIAASSQGRRGWVGLLGSVVSLNFFKAVGALALVLFLAGLAVWFFERRSNAEQFGGRPQHGLGNGFWWAAVTMTTVGYGDRAPITIGGRAVALVWMFASLVLVSGFTAAIASALTVGHLTAVVRDPGDLPRVRVGTMEGTTSEAYLRAENMRPASYQDVVAGLADLASGRLDAFVYDEPILLYLARRDFPGSVYVLPYLLVREQYAFALAQGSALREPINRELLEILSTVETRRMTEEYLGSR